MVDRRLKQAEMQMRLDEFLVDDDPPIEVNANGASQSKVQHHVTSIDPATLLGLARVHAEGDAKYGRDNWRGVSPNDHLNHAMVHMLAWLAGDRTEPGLDHLLHAMCRVGMAHAVANEGS
jgi:hypothetical protein